MDGEEVTDEVTHTAFLLAIAKNVGKAGFLYGLPIVFIETFQHFISNRTITLFVILLIGLPIYFHFVHRHLKIENINDKLILRYIEKYPKHFVSMLAAGILVTWIVNFYLVSSFISILSGNDFVAKIIMGTLTLMWFGLTAYVTIFWGRDVKNHLFT